MTIAEWVVEYPAGVLRSRAYTFDPDSEPAKLRGLGFNVGDILCVPHGPWIYLFGVVAVTDQGGIAQHELVSLR